MFRRVGVFGLFLLVGACGSQPTPTPTPTPTATDIPASVSGPLSANLSALAQSSSGQSALAAQGAALALQAGVQAVPVTLTASLVATPHAGSRSSALDTYGPGYAFAYQVTVVNTQGGSPAPGVYSGVVAYVDASDAAFAMGPSPMGTFAPIPAGGTAVGSIFAGGDTEIWHATAGQESAHLVTPGANCAGGLPSYVTACTKGSFTAALNIMASTSTAVGDTSSKTALMPSTNTVPGVVLTVDYTQQVSVSVYPPSQTVAPGGTVQFGATVTGPSGTNTAVVWSVITTTGGSITNTSTVPHSPPAGIYTAGSDGMDTVVATQVGSTPPVTGKAIVTVATPPSVTFFNYWAPEPCTPQPCTDYTLNDATTGAMLSTGAVTFSINDSAQYGLYMALLCVEGGEVAADAGTTTTFGITGLITSTGLSTSATCQFVGQPTPPCTSSAISYSVGSGTLNPGPPASLTINFDGTVTGLDPTACTAMTQYTGQFGPAAVYSP